MNKRDFFKTLAAATAGFAILPAATTYGRIWRAKREVVWVRNPEWDKARYEVVLIQNRPVFDERFLETEKPHEPIMRYNMERGRLQPVYPWMEIEV